MCEEFVVCFKCNLRHNKVNSLLRLNDYLNWYFNQNLRLFLCTLSLGIVSGVNSAWTSIVSFENIGWIPNLCPLPMGVKHQNTHRGQELYTPEG